MKNVLVRLQEYRAQANGAEKGLVRFLMEKPEEAVKMSIHKLAECTYTSAATVIRLCKKLGFAGYKDFTISLNYELARRSEARGGISTEIRRDDRLMDIVDKVTYRGIQALEDTRKLVDLDELQRCVDTLEGAVTVGLFGIGSSLLAARDMYLKFLRLNKPCICNDDLHSQFVCARNLSSGDGAIIFSYSGLTREMITCARILKEQNVPVITVTRFGESELTRLAAYPVLACILSRKLFYFGYKSGLEGMSGFMATGKMDILTNSMNFMGLLVVGALTASFVTCSVPFQIVKDVFDAATGQVLKDQVIFNADATINGIFPGLVPLALTLGVYYLYAKKKWTPMKLMGIILVLAAVLTAIGCMSGFYA